MDIALIEHSKDDVDDDQCRDDQIRLALQRRLERLRRALKAAGHGARQVNVRGRLLDRGDRIAESRSRGQVERQRDGRELPLVIDREIADVLRIEVDESRQRHLLPREG